MFKQKWKILHKRVFPLEQSPFVVILSESGKVQPYRATNRRTGYIENFLNVTFRLFARQKKPIKGLFPKDKSIRLVNKSETLIKCDRPKIKVELLEFVSTLAASTVMPRLILSIMEGNSRHRISCGAATSKRRLSCHVTGFYSQCQILATGKTSYLYGMHLYLKILLWRGS